ncbi:helix-hairpin-helix domain-containing protein [Pseudarthrobacter sp. PvP090]|uniref:helix-hairpin-helix domain-containing protein n=1 Tax=Pseudarthrobacter sp. PvP090 TaxID=3156393 RepID=UPI00339B8D20
MPRHNPGDPPGTEPGRTDRRLAAAVRPGTETGLLGGPPVAAPFAGQRDPGPVEAPLRSHSIRWRTGPQAATLLCLLAAALLGWFWLQAANATTEVSPLSSINPSEAGGPPDPEPETGPSPAPDSSPDDGDGDGNGDGDSGGGVDTRDSIIVHVAGAVVRAGIVELPRGSRLHEAIAASGGNAPDADPDQLNLAAILEDGQKVLVPRQGETVPAASAPTGDAGARGSPSSASVSPGAKINLNTAGAEELATLPRVGPVLAQRIVDWRSEHGKFQRVEELDAVDGFGPKLLEGVLPLVRV